MKKKRPLNVDELTTADWERMREAADRFLAAFEYLESKVRARRAPLWVRCLRKLGMSVEVVR